MQKAVLFETVITVSLTHALLSLKGFRRLLGSQIIISNFEKYCNNNPTHQSTELGFCKPEYLQMCLLFVQEAFLEAIGGSGCGNHSHNSLVSFFGDCKLSTGNKQWFVWAIFFNLSAKVTLNWFSKGIAQNPLNSGLGIILICPD